MDEILQIVNRKSEAGQHIYSELTRTWVPLVMERPGRASALTKVLRSARYRRTTLEQVSKRPDYQSEMLKLEDELSTLL